jgi:ABC-2 type transport system permease protein
MPMPPQPDTVTPGARHRRPGVVRLFARYLIASLHGQMQYRTSFLMASVGQFLAVGIEFLAILALFARFGSLRGWTLPEVALLYGIANVAFALAEGLGRGFDTFSTMVRTGDFDRLLVRPLPTALQVACQEFQLLRIGRLTQGLIALFWAVSALHLHWTLPRVLLLAGAVAGGACVFYGLFVLQATLCFWTVESLEIMNALTYGGTETAQYPLPVYRPWMRRLFTYVVPLACMNYLPVGALLGHPAGTGPLPAALRWASPLIGVLFLLVSLQIWRLGERRYQSTGS